jgi:2-polyprenyl-3-methyl-5-hydroxy-6-metoxy-1,4-benzoquinol methylase
MIELDPKFFPADPEFLMLDVGPGVGALAESYARDRRVVAVEYDERLAKEAALRATPGGTLSVCRGDGQRIPVRSASADGVIVLEMLEHVENPDQVLAEASRVLRPGGALCVAVPTSYTEAVYSRLNPRYWQTTTHVRIFKKDDLLARIGRQGFAVQYVRPQHLEPAICWFVHSVLRSDADPTGWILEHQSVEPKVDRLVARVAGTRYVGRVVPWLRERVGKSWYVYARKTAR